MDKRDIYKAVLGMIDLTSLNGSDTYTKIAAMTGKVNRFHDTFPDYPLPASICVYPNFARFLDVFVDDHADLGQGQLVLRRHAGEVGVPLEGRLLFSDLCVVPERLERAFLQHVLDAFFRKTITALQRLHYGILSV